MEIAQGLHAISGPVATCYLITDGADGLILVDTGLRGGEKNIWAALRKIGRAPGDLRHIIITHADGDHYGCLNALTGAGSPKVYASAPEAAAIRAGGSSRPLKAAGLARLLYRLVAPLFRALPARVDEILADGAVFPALGGLRVLATPGHTPGHISLYAPARGILIAGDSLTIDGAGKLSGSRGANTWDTALAEQSYRAQLALKPELICAAHSGWKVMPA